LHNIGRNQSNTARKEIEITFKLHKAEEQGKPRSEEITPLNTQRVNYGRSATKRGIMNVLHAVLTKYKYSSLPELNAVLRLYNVTADRGKENGLIYQKRGLVYRVLDGKGNKIGVPIKASSIYNKPTLGFLELRFNQNESLKHNFKRNLKTSIDWILIKAPKNLEAFRESLQKEKISLIVRQNENGIIYGLTYIDHNTKCVFNGNEIGKEYSAKAILQKFGVSQAFSTSKASKRLTISNDNLDLRVLDNSKQEELSLSKMMDEIIGPTEEIQYLPYDLKKRKKTKKK